jgi:hypothetical protein
VGHRPCALVLLLVSLAYLHPMFEVVSLGNSVTLKPKRLDVSMILRDRDTILHEVTTDNFNKGLRVNLY